MNLSTLYVSAAIILVTTSPQQSLRERARTEGGTVTNELELEYGVSSIPELVAQSNLVVYGRIASIKTLLTSDEQFVATEYEVVPLRIVKQSHPLNTSPKPGKVPSIVVRRIGGSLTEGAFHYLTTTNTFPKEEPLSIGEEVVLFLRDRQGNAGGYNLTAGPFAAFRVSNGQAIPVSDEAVKRRGDKPVAIAAFLEDLQQRAGRRH